VVESPEVFIGRCEGCGMSLGVRQIARQLSAAVAGAARHSTLHEQQMLLLGQIAARQNAGLERVVTLADAEFRVFSQNGEDGIIDWLVGLAPGIPERFIEFGVESYTESNTRFLLRNRNWRGMVIDGSAENIDRIRADEISWQHDLTAVASFITAENIESLIADAGFAGELGILSVDIDGNDYWVWQAIGNASPWLVIAEYNAVFGDLHPLSVPYRPDFARTRADSSNLYFGASAKALQHLAASKGYACLGSNRAGNNLFFAREDIAAGMVSRIDDPRPRPSRFRESRDAHGQLSHLGGMARTEGIGALPVVDVVSGNQMPLQSIDGLFSDEWLAEMRGDGAR